MMQPGWGECFPLLLGVLLVLLLGSAHAALPDRSEFVKGKSKYTHPFALLWAPSLPTAGTRGDGGPRWLEGERRGGAPGRARLGVQAGEAGWSGAVAGSGWSRLGPGPLLLGTLRRRARGQSLGPHSACIHPGF